MLGKIKNKTEMVINFYKTLTGIHSVYSQQPSIHSSWVLISNFELQYFKSTILERCNSGKVCIHCRVLSRVPTMPQDAEHSETLAIFNLKKGNGTKNFGFLLNCLPLQAAYAYVKMQSLLQALYSVGGFAWISQNCGATLRPCVVLTQAGVRCMLPWHKASHVLHCCISQR